MNQPRRLLPWRDLYEINEEYRKKNNWTCSRHPRKIDAINSRCMHLAMSTLLPLMPDVRDVFIDTDYTLYLYSNLDNIKQILKEHSVCFLRVSCKKHMFMIKISIKYRYFFFKYIELEILDTWIPSIKKIKQLEELVQAIIGNYRVKVNIPLWELMKQEYNLTENDYTRVRHGEEPVSIDFIIQENERIGYCAAWSLYFAYHSFHDNINQCYIDIISHTNRHELVTDFVNHMLLYSESIFS